MSDFPLGWVSASIADVIDLNPKNTAPDDIAAGFMPMNLLGKNYGQTPTFEIRQWGEIGSSYVHFAEGDVLLAKITPCFENGKAGIVTGLPNGIGAGSSEYFVCRPKHDALDPRYLLAFFKTQTFLDAGARQMTGSVGHKRVPKDYLLRSQLPLAPLAEQKRIADKLDTLLARIDTCRERLDRLPVLIKRFRQSVLAAATTGWLTKDWREAETSANWTNCTVGDVTQSSFYGPRFGANDYTKAFDGTPTIRTTDMTANGVIEVTSETPRVIVPADKIEHYRVMVGDLLITRTGSIGVMALFDAEYVAIPSAYLIRFRFNERVLPRYVFLALMAPAGQEALGLSSTALTQPNINAEAIKRIPLYLPQLPEQTEIVRRVATLFAFADRLEDRLTQAQIAIDRQTPSLLAKAFRGELVPQDPTDEPAQALLDRLKSQSIHDERPKRGKRTTSTATV